MALVFAVVYVVFSLFFPHSFFSGAAGIAVALSEQGLTSHPRRNQGPFTSLYLHVQRVKCAGFQIRTLPKRVFCLPNHEPGQTRTSTIPTRQPFFHGCHKANVCKSLHQTPFVTSASAFLPWDMCARLPVADSHQWYHDRRPQKEFRPPKTFKRLVTALSWPRQDSAVVPKLEHVSWRELSKWPVFPIEGSPSWTARAYFFRQRSLEMCIPEPVTP